MKLSLRGHDPFTFVRAPAGAVALFVGACVVAACSSEAPPTADDDAALEVAPPGRAAQQADAQDAAIDAGPADAAKPPPCPIDFKALNGFRARVSVKGVATPYGTFLDQVRCSGSTTNGFALTAGAGGAQTPTLDVRVPSANGTFSGAGETVEYAYSEVRQCNVFGCTYDRFTHTSAGTSACRVCVVGWSNELAGHVTCTALPQVGGARLIDLDAEFHCPVTN